MDARPPPLPYTFRPWLSRWVLLGLAVVVPLVLGGTTVALSRGSGAFTTADQIGMGTITALVLGGLWLLNRPRIKADDAGIEVINVFGRRRLEWAEVLDVSLRPDDPWLVLDLADGTTMNAMGVQTSDGRRGQLAARQLAALVEAHTATPYDQ